MYSKGETSSDAAHIYKSISRVSNQLSADMYIQTLPHGDEAMAETWDYYRNEAWTQVSCHSQNGTQPSLRAVQVTV